ncbi:MAG: hypothetical protein R3E01_36175 [Pirellulaceae bacterium]|nr:hypothetical protein [Planctomycetales bacterium]
MSKLTVTEKEHWKERVERRISKAIDALSQQHPSFLAEIQEKSRAKALQALGALDTKQQLDELKRQMAELENEKSRVERVHYSKITGKPEAECQQYYVSSEADRVIKSHQSLIEDELLAQSKVGQRFLALHREKDELLDTIWLATSNQQIKDLWRRVADVLGDQATDLQKDILETHE